MRAYLRLQYTTDPRRSQDIRKAVEDAKEHLSPTARSVRRRLQKLEKVVDKDNLERARLKERIRYLEGEMRTSSLLNERGSVNLLRASLPVLTILLKRLKRHGNL